jgi:hypothetical protein
VHSGSIQVAKTELARDASMMRVLLGAPLFVLLGMSLPQAQERVPNPGKQGVLRSWPYSGVWGVALVRLVDGPLGCWLVTGHTNPTSGETYLWGIRWRSEGVAATITDNNQQAIAGPSIRIIIDQVTIGDYQISRRVVATNGFHNIVAEFPATERGRILNLFTVGGSMQFVTNGFTYSASLQGAKQAMENLKDCSVEATNLNAGAVAPSDTAQGK